MVSEAMDWHFGQRGNEDLRLPQEAVMIKEKLEEESLPGEEN